MNIGLGLNKYQYLNGQSDPDLFSLKKKDNPDLYNQDDLPQMLSLGEVELIAKSTPESAVKHIEHLLGAKDVSIQDSSSTPKLNSTNMSYQILSKSLKYIAQMPGAAVDDISFSNKEFSSFVDCLVFTEVVGFGGLLSFGEDRYMYREQWSHDPVGKIKDNLYYRWTWNQFSVENDILGHGGLAWALYGNARYNYGLSRTQSVMLGVLSNNLHEVNEAPVARGLAGKDAVYTSSMCVVAGLLDWAGERIDNGWGLALQAPFRLMKFVPKTSLGYKDEKFSLSYSCKWNDVIDESDNKENYSQLKVTQLKYWIPKLQIQHNLLQNRSTSHIEYSSQKNGDASVATDKTSGLLDFNASVGVGRVYVGAGIGGYNFSNEINNQYSIGSTYVDNGEITPYFYAKASLLDNKIFSLSTETMLDFSKTKIYTPKKKPSGRKVISNNTNLTIMGRLGIKTSAYNSYGLKAGVTLPAFDHKMGEKAGDYQLESAEPQLYLGVDFTKSKISIGKLWKSIAREFTS